MVKARAVNLVDARLSPHRGPAHYSGLQYQFGHCAVEPNHVVGRTALSVEISTKILDRPFDRRLPAVLTYRKNIVHDALQPTLCSPIGNMLCKRLA